MVETFYGVLGVAPDADDQTIVRAYRDRAKDCHPDVSDSPDATAQFKRLTTAKEVLVDETERARYDRLGHEAYVSQCVECSGWTVEGESSAAAGGTSTSSAARTARAYAGSSTTSGGADVSRQSTTPSGGGTATAYYRPGQRMRPDAAGTVDGILDRLQAVGAWAVVDVALLLSAFATAGLILAWGSASAVSFVFAAGLVVTAIAAATLHLSVRAYT